MSVRFPESNQNRSHLILHNISYSGTSFQTVVFTFSPILDALRGVAPTFAALPTHVNHFYPKHTPGRGIGLFSARNFGAGDTIILERPALIHPQAMAPQDLARLPELVERLPSDQRFSSQLLAVCKSDRPGFPWALDMTSTNSYAFELPVPHLPARELLTWLEDRDKETLDADIGWVHSMVFLETARLNHSCSPNTASFWDCSQLVLRIRAIRAIPAHTELTITYLHDLCASQAERREDLLNKYAFHCACSACTIPASISDRRRKRLSAGKVDLERWARWRADPPVTREGMEDAIRTCDVVLAHARVEGLDDACLAYTVHVDWRARALAAIGDTERFLPAAREACWAWEAQAQDPTVGVEGFVEIWTEIIRVCEMGGSIRGWGVLGKGSWMMNWGRGKDRSVSRPAVRTSN